ncbi:hypothetical protein BURPS1710b_3743 [Burkholderia pseudomallei 1710b]|uniref:Uncharacterized protein n=1 Tax=Burkholderia pseudomallei (strain 1710b) TaxID=320372 RepID=Q3JMU7_BURP1|nr:hypothetical protein BURPS1710b_3743 [Burkholderia pseudomallei 1710b]
MLPSRVLGAGAIGRAEGRRAEGGPGRVARLHEFLFEVERLARGGHRHQHADARARILEPEPEASLAHVEHREDAGDEQQAAKIHQILARRARQLEHRRLHLLERIELQINRRAVQETVRQRVDRVLHEAHRILRLLDGRLARAFARDLPNLPHRTLEHPQQQGGGLLLLVLRHRAVDERRDRLEAADRIAVRATADAAVRAGEQGQDALRAVLEPVAQRGIARAERMPREAARRLDAHGRIFERRAQPHPFADAVAAVSRNPQIAERVVRARAHAREEHALAAHVDGQHVVVEFARLAVLAAHLVLNRRPDVVQFDGLRRLRAGAEPLVEEFLDRAVRRDAARVGLAVRVGDVLDVDRTEIGELDGLAVGARRRERHRIADRALERERRGARARHRIRGHFHQRAAVLETRLIDRHALVRERLVDLDARRNPLARLAIDDDDVAREELRHAGRVIVDDEFLELDRERQILDQRARRLIEDRRRYILALRHPRVAAKRRIRRGQPVLGSDLADRRARVDGALAEHPHLEFDRQVAVEQTAHADHDDREVRGDVAELRHRAALRGDERRAARFAHDMPIARLRDERGDGLRRARAIARDRELRLVMKRAQAAFADLVLPALRVGEHLRRVADHAQRDRHDEEDQDQHEPPRAVDRIEAQRAEDVGPERAELIDVVRVRIVLRENRADDARDRQDDEQRDRKSHRAQQLDRAPDRGRSRSRLQPRRGNAHSNSNSQQKRARRPYFDGAPPFSCSSGRRMGGRLVHSAREPETRVNAGRRCNRRRP